MRFNKVCKELAAKVLGKPGTIVECIVSGVSKGTYTVAESSFDLSSKGCINIKDYGWHLANNFRKVIEKE